MKFKNTLLIASLLFSLNLLFFYVSKYTKRRPSSIANTQSPISIKKFTFEDSRQFLEKNTKDIKINLLEGFQWRTDHKALDLSFSNPLIENSKQEAIIWCQIFPYVEILLTAQKVSVNGESPSILTTINCPQSANDTIDFHISFARVFNFEPKDQSVQIENSKMELRNFDEFWPEEWMVKSIKFYNKNLEGITLSNYELYSFLGYHLEIKKN